MGETVSIVEEGLERSLGDAVTRLRQTAISTTFNNADGTLANNSFHGYNGSEVFELFTNDLQIDYETYMEYKVILIVIVIILILLYLFL